MFKMVLSVRSYQLAMAHAVSFVFELREKSRVK